MKDEVWKREVEQALAQVKLKNQPAFAKLYDMTSSSLFGIIVKIVPDRDLAEDILQESYQKIWINASQHRADLGSAWSWLCQVVRNHAIDRYRQRKNLREDDDTAVSQPHEFYSTEMWPEHVDLGRCLKEIKKEQQNIIIHSYVYGWSHSELTKQFKIPLGTLKSWIRRGLQELKLCLEA